MKLFFPLFALLAATFVVASWTSQDYEIFSLNDKIKSDLGVETTFYSWLKLQKGPKSTIAEINKAYRKLTRALHPDKFGKKSRSEKKKAEERFQRLSLVGNILRDNSLKQRYDFFLDKGFPKWKGTGYYYSRFRPGPIFTVLVLYVLVSTFQYVSLRISRKQDHRRIAELRQEIKVQAWGGSMIPPSDGSSRKVMGPNGLEFMVSPVGEVSLIQKDENGETISTILDEDDIDVNPGFRLSFFFKIPAGLYNLTVGKLTGYNINTEVEYVNPNKKNIVHNSAEETKKPLKRKSAQRGDKVELPNGKVIYTRKKK